MTRQDIRGWWIGFVGILLFGILAHLSLDAAPSWAFNWRGAGLLWMAIYQDFYQGIYLAIGMSLSIALSIVTWRKFPVSSAMNLWMSLLWGSPAVLRAVFILTKSDYLTDPESAVIPWSTHDQYLSDNLVQSGSLWIGMSLAVVTSIIVSILNKKRKTQAESSGTLAPSI